VLVDFFRLPGEPTPIDQAELLRLAEVGNEIHSKVYDQPTLTSPQHPKRRRVQDCNFREVSFANVAIDRLEFKNCTFTSCLFIGTIFRDCRFSGCAFVDCNTFRIELIDVYVDPRSFDQCLDKRRHQNIGVHLYQELLNNSRRQSQPDFTQDALFLFRQWLRFETIYELRQPGWTLGDRVGLALQIGMNWMAEILFGYGVRLRNYVRTASSVALLFATLNYCFIPEFGLKIDQQGPWPFIDALYFTIITLTTVGYGDIAPEATLGRIIVSGEAVVGFFLFAILASMIYRKFQV
jgi:hypothetical protein